MASSFFQQQFTLYLHLDVLGAFHVRENLFANFSTSLRIQPPLIRVPQRRAKRVSLFVAGRE